MPRRRFALAVRCELVCQDLVPAQCSPAKLAKVSRDSRVPSDWPPDRRSWLDLRKVKHATHVRLAVCGCGMSWGILCTLQIELRRPTEVGLCDKYHETLPA